MKDLGMSWSEIKNTPRYEIMGLIGALRQYEALHAFDGYSDKDIADMAKDRPDVRSSYREYKELREKYISASGKKRSVSSFESVMHSGK